MYYGKTPIEFDASPDMRYWFYLHSVRNWNYFPQHDTIASNKKIKFESHRVNNLMYNVNAHTVQPPLVPMNVPIEFTELQINTTPLYLVGAGTILAGVASATAKLRSDKLYEQYVAEWNDDGIKNETLRNEVRRLDTVSAISLVLRNLVLVYFVHIIEVLIPKIVVYSYENDQHQHKYFYLHGDFFRLRFQTRRRKKIGNITWRGAI